MKKKSAIVLCCIFLVVCGFLLGLQTSNYMNKIKYPQTEARIYGLWTNDLESLKSYKGSFICIDINTTKTLKELEAVCEHEVGHEIFARQCETNFTKCLEVEK